MRALTRIALETTSDPGHAQQVTALGRVIGDRYRLLYPLGKGGMGAVWVGEHIELGVNVAVKFIDPRFVEDERARKRFRREARAAAALQGTHVVQVFDYGIDGSDPYIVMELLAGETLAARLEREGRLPVEQVEQMLTQSCKALARAHERGIIHRDLKPENVFLVDDNPGFTVKLLDFGVAKLLDERSKSEMVTQHGQLLGTLYYMSPEQFDGASSVDARADVWALGVMVFECLTGDLPVDAESSLRLIAALKSEPLPKPSSVANVPEGFDEWFERATHKDPALRESSVAALAEAFATLAKGVTGKCAVRTGRSRHSIPTVLAYSSSDEANTLERAGERPSSIPAAINGKRDINHIALIAKLGATRAVLWTRHRAEPGQTIRLTLHFDDESAGETTLAEVVSVDDNPGDRPEMWPCEVTVRFETPLEGIEQKIGRAGSPS
jgi:serine/threonine-protein kinase